MVATSRLALIANYLRPDIDWQVGMMVGFKAAMLINFYGERWTTIEADSVKTRLAWLVHLPSHGGLLGGHHQSKSDGHLQW